MANRHDLPSRVKAIVEAQFDRHGVPKRKAAWTLLVIGLALAPIAMLRAHQTPTGPAATWPTPAEFHQIMMGARHVTIRVSDDVTTWRKELPTVLSFTDPECPSCRYATTALSQVEGIRIATFFYPLPQHQDAHAAAIACEAAGRQRAFDRFVAALAAFETPDKAALVSAAREAGLDIARFNQDRRDPALEAHLHADRKWAQRFGVDSVPTFFLRDPGGKIERFVGLSALMQRLKSPNPARSTSFFREHPPVEVQISGVCYNPETGQDWRTPEGRTQIDAPFDPAPERDPILVPFSPRRAPLRSVDPTREIAVHLRGLDPNSWVRFRWAEESQFLARFNDHATKNGRYVTRSENRCYAISLMVPPGVERKTLLTEAQLGRWETVWEQPVPMNQWVALPGRPMQLSLYSMTFYDRRAEVHLRTTDITQVYRVAALDRRGHWLYAQVSGLGPEGYSCEFRCRPRDIVRLRVDAQPWRPVSVDTIQVGAR